MTAEATLWARYCRLLLTHSELGFSLDFSRVKFPDSYLAKMRPAAEAALKAMAEIEKGAIANADEKRMVGHYWLRAPELAPKPELGDDVRKALAQVEAFAKQVHSGAVKGEKGAFTHVLSLGIGGSALGPELVAHALGSADDKLIPVFINNTDPDGIDDVVKSLEGKLGTTIVLVMSKSGGTPETRNAMLEVEAAYKKAGLNFGKHAAAITQEGSALDKKAVADGWLTRFPMWDWVGGRTSVTSTVGLVPAALQGIDVRAFLAGAAKMDAWTRLNDAEKNPASMMALMWYYLGDGRGAKDMVVLPYKDRLVLFSRYLQQLVMESLGKKLDRHGKVVEQGIAVYGNKGSTDQHAYVQQLRDGLANFFITFIQVLTDRAGSSLEVEPGVTSGDYLFGFLEGTRAALYDSDRESITLTIEKISPESLGALIALYERTVGLYAELVDINAYHQPGVEAGKKAAAEVLALQAKVVAQLKTAKTPATAEAIAKAIGSPGDVETIWKILEHLGGNPGRGVKRTGGTNPADATFAAS